MFSWQLGQYWNGNIATNQPEPLRYQHGQPMLPRSQRPHAPLWLDALPLLVEIDQQPVVVLIEQVAGEVGQAGEDVTGAGGILAALQPRSELACTGRGRWVG